MRKQKILFITPSLCYGGLENFLISMLQFLDEEKYECVLYLYIDDMALLPFVPKHVKVVRDKDDNHYFRKPKALVLNVASKIFKLLRMKKLSEKYSAELRAYVHSEKMKHPARDIFRNDQFDVVVANAVGKPTEMALHINAERKLTFFHSSVDVHHELLEKLFPRYDGIVAVSNGVKEMLQNAYPEVKDKILLLENYVDAEEIINKSNLTGINLNVAPDVTTICSCGRLSSEKGFDLAVEAAVILKQKDFIFKWYFIGDGPEREQIESKIVRYNLKDNICITGYIDNPYPFMRACDIYVQPSYEESYGRTIKEAIILGKAVVSTATVGGNMLIQNEETGILTEINPQGLADGVIKLLEKKTLKNKLENSYSIEQNKMERQTFKAELDRLLS